MATMGEYCKAYVLKDLRRFGAWSEAAENVRKELQEVDGEEVEVVRTLTHDDYLFLQEDYTVTDGIYLGECVIFANVTPEWIDFCKNVLKFEKPGDVSGPPAEAAAGHEAAGVKESGE